MNADFHEFLAWEKATRDTVDFKCIYVDMAGDLVAGLMLSQLVYWCLLPDKEGRSKLRVFQDGYHWAAKSRDAWWDEIRLSPKQADRAIRILVERGLVVKKNSLFNAKRTPHLRIVWDAFYEAWRANLPEVEPRAQPNESKTGGDQTGTPVSTDGEHRSCPKGETGIDQRAIPLTEIPTERTAEMTTEAAAAASVQCSKHNVPMKLRTKGGDQWYSHQLPDGTWCKGAPGDQSGSAKDWRNDSEKRRQRYVTEGVMT